MKQEDESQYHKFTSNDLPPHTICLQFIIRLSRLVNISKETAEHIQTVRHSR
jgi:hypothetical protein